MAQLILKEKEDVLDPVSLLTTIGQEIADLYAQKRKDIISLGIMNLVSKEKLTEKQLRKVQTQLGFEESFVSAMLAYQDEYARHKVEAKQALKQSKANFRKLKGVIPLLKNDFKDGIDRLEDILDFFGKDSEEEIFAQAIVTGALYREQNQTAVDEINLYGWLRRGELDYEKVKGSLPDYNKEKLLAWIEAGEWKTKLTSTIYFKKLPELLKPFGVVVTLIPYLTKTVYGAVKWIDGHPVVMISDRGQDLASCWFTLFHEFGHVFLHEDVKTSVDGMINDCSKSTKDKREREANKFANSYLFNGDELRKYIFELKREGNYETVKQIGDRFQVAEMFVGYWMHKAQYYPSAYPHHSITFAY